MSAVFFGGSSDSRKPHGFLVEESMGEQCTGGLAQIQGSPWSPSRSETLHRLPLVIKGSCRRRRLRGSERWGQQRTVRHTAKPTPSHPFRVRFAHPPPLGHQGEALVRPNAPQLKTYHPSPHPSRCASHLSLKGKALGRQNRKNRILHYIRFCADIQLFLEQKFPLLFPGGGSCIME